MYPLFCKSLLCWQMWAPLSCRCNATARGSMNSHILQSWTALRSLTHINAKHVYLNSADFHWAGKDSVTQAQYYLVPTDANNTLNDSNCRESFLMFLVVPELKPSLTQTFLLGEKFKNVLLLQKWAVFSKHSKRAGTSTTPLLIYLSLHIGSISKWCFPLDGDQSTDIQTLDDLLYELKHSHSQLWHLKLYTDVPVWLVNAAAASQAGHTVLNFSVV